MKTQILKTALLAIFFVTCITAYGQEVPKFDYLEVIVLFEGCCSMDDDLGLFPEEADGGEAEPGNRVKHGDHKGIQTGHPSEPPPTHSHW